MFIFSLIKNGGLIPNKVIADNWLTHTLLFDTLCRLLLCSSKHFAPQHILIPGTLCLLNQFAFQHILLPGTICSVEHFAPWNILLLLKNVSPNILCSLEHKKQSVLGRKVFHEAKCAKEKSILKSKVR
jgi:hypothetical protein